MPLQIRLPVRQYLEILEYLFTYYLLLNMHFTLLFSNRYLVESKHVEVLQKLLKDPTIQQCRLRRDGDDDLLASALPNKPAASISKSGEPEKPITANVPEDISQFYQQLDKDDDEDEATDIAANTAVAFEVDPDKIEVVA